MTRVPTHATDAWRVTWQVIHKRAQIAVEERITLNKAEYRGVQNLLTQRLRSTLATQNVARLNAYRFRAKASQHLDIQSADNWSAERALALLTSESLKMKHEYDHMLSQHADEIAHRQEEARNAQERSAARQRIRAAFDTGVSAVKLNRLKDNVKGGGKRVSARGSPRVSRERSSPVRAGR